MIERVLDAGRINAVLNDPSVFPWVAAKGVETFDLTPVMDRLVVLMTEHGGFIFERLGEDTWEVHTQFLPEGRGKALEAARQAADYVFHRGCGRIVTRVPKGNVPAARLAERMGFKYVGTEGTWTYPDERVADVDWFELSKEMWECQRQR